MFIVDTSGSMQGRPLENVKRAVSTALSELVEGDYFNIITFNDELHSFSSCLEQVNDKAIASATDWMNENFVAEGGTDVMHPLSEVCHFEQLQLGFFLSCNPDFSCFVIHTGHFFM